MQIYDISMTIHPHMAMFEDDPAPRLSIWEQPSEQNSFTTSKLELLSHTGTHVDAPSHLFPGTKTIDKVLLDDLVGEALVIEVLADGNFSPHSDPQGKIILLKTGESTYLRKGVFRSNFMAPNAIGIKKLIDANIKAIGIDTFSIDNFETEVINHSLLLEASIPIIEGLDLSKVPLGEYFCVCLPLKLQDLDGAPARAIIIRWDEGVFDPCKNY
jgi:arylformamidase